MMMMMMINMMVMIMRRIPGNEGEEGERKDRRRKDVGGKGERKEGLSGRKECRIRMSGEGCACDDNCLTVQSFSMFNFVGFRIDSLCLCNHLFCCLSQLGLRICNFHLYVILSRIIMNESGFEEQQCDEFDVCGDDNCDVMMIGAS